MICFSTRTIIPGGSSLFLTTFACTREPGQLAFSIESLPATERVATRDMVFILDGFQVSCNAMPAYLEQGEIVRCEMDDFVTEGWLVLNMHGFPSAFGESLEFGCPST